MNDDSIKTIGINQISRKEAILHHIRDVDGLINTFDNDSFEWNDFDSWDNISVQKWIFERAMDIYLGKKIDIKCDCCEYNNLSQGDLETSSNKKCFGIKSAYMIEKVFREILFAKARRERDGTYSA